MNSSTSSSRRWLRIFFAIVVPICVGYLAASEWLVRTEIAPHDNFETISSLLRASTEPNAAFGDSHVAAVPAYNSKDFVNLGIGATTIRKMDQRVRYYFAKIKPGEVIIQADPHLFAEYRLQAQGDYVPEDYSNLRLRALDPQHRGFMRSYWSAFLLKRSLSKESINYDQLWQAAHRLPGADASGRQAEAATQAATRDPPVQVPASAATAQKPSGEKPAQPTSEVSVQQQPSGELAHKPSDEKPAKPASEATVQQPPRETPTPKPSGETPAQPASEVAVQQPASETPAPKPSDKTPAQQAPAALASDAAPELAKFNAVMDSEVSTHTPVRDFRSRDEARIYRNMIGFLISRGARVCLVNYPVDRFYRERADSIPMFAETRDFYKEVAREYHIPYVSLWDRFDDPSMFQNADHVNQNGSPILAREARKACFGTSN